MPKRLNIHPNERVDLVDFSVASSSYTTEKASFTLDRTYRDAFARFLRGFSVSFDGNQITVFNGVAIDRSGEVLNNEDQANASRTVTLPTTPSQAYYLEVLFTEAQTDTDGRAFWDPTFTNPSPVPSGRDFLLNVSTTWTPDWTVEFNTTGFATSVNPNSRRIPLIQVKTGVSGLIDPGSAGFQFGTSVLSSVMLEDVQSGTTSFRVVDPVAFRIGDAINVDALGSGLEAATVANIDYVNGIITLGGPLTNAHLAGSIIRRTTGGTFLLQETNPNDLVGRADVRKRMFQGDEIRGSALTVDRDGLLPTDRSDLDVATIKDEVDFLSAQIRELKFGSLRSDTNQASLPVSYSALPRYFDNAGGVAGARSFSITIGDGVNSFGDFNGLDELPFLTAAAFLQTLPVPGGSVFVKRGTYSFTGPVTLASSTTVVGEGRTSTFIINQSTTDPAFICSSAGPVVNVTFKDMALQRTVLATTDVVEASTSGVRLSFEDCSLTGDIASPTAPTAVYGRDSLFRNIVLAGTSTAVRLQNCDFIGTSGVANIQGGTADSVLNSCRFFTGSALQLTSVTNLVLNGCSFITPTVLSASTSASNVRVVNCTHTGTAASATAVIDLANSTDTLVQGFRSVSTQNGTSAGTRGSIVNFSGTATRALVTDSILRAGATSFVDGVRFGATSTTACAVRNSVVADCFAAVIHQNSVAYSTLDVADVTVVPSASGRCHYGVRIEHSATNRCDASVSDSRFFLDGSQATYTCFGVSVTGTSNHSDMVKVADCSFGLLSASLNSSAVSVSGTSDVCKSISVVGCKLIAPNGAPQASLLRSNASSAVVMSGNSAADIVSSNAEVVSVSDSASVVFSNNNISDVISGAATIVLFTDCSNVTANGNNVDITPAFSTEVFVHRTASGSSSNVAISNNNITLRHTASVTAYGVYVDAASGITNGTVSHNRILSTGGGVLNGIRVDSTGTTEDVLVVGNSISESVANAATTPIFIDRVSGTFTNLVVNSNCVSAPNASRTPTPAIFVKDVTGVTITGNSGDFAGGIGIETQACVGLSVTGNSIQQSYLLGGTDVLVLGNTLDSALGSIVLTSATGIRPAESPAFTPDSAFIRQFNICASAPV